MNVQTKSNDSLKTDVIIYLCMLILSGVQVLLAYRLAEGGQLMLRMLAVALLQAGLGGMYFIYLRDERRSLRLALISCHHSCAA